MRKSRRSRGPARDSIRSRLLSQWWGADQRLDPEANVSSPADWLQEILAGLQLSDGIEESRLRGAWREVAGDFVAAQTEPVSFRKGILTLKVLQPSMRFHLEQSRGDILARLKKSLGASQIREIRLTIG